MLLNTKFIIRIKGRLNRYYPSSLVGSSIIRIGHRLDNRIFPPSETSDPVKVPE